ncbi:MAG: diguanylate cyclase [Acidithiobacillus sp.]
MRLETLLQQIDKGDCPSPSQSTLALMELLQQDDAGMDDAIKLMKLDPILTAKIIKLANSALYRGSRPAIALEDAVMRIGLQVVVRLTLGLTLASQKPPLTSHFDLQRFWSTSVLRAVAMQALAQQLGGWPASDIFILGLLSEIGALLMACTAPEAWEASENEKASVQSQLEQESRTFGFNRRQLSAALMRQWRLPEFMVIAVEAQHVPTKLDDQEDGNSRLRILATILEAGRSISEWALTRVSTRSIETLQAEAKDWWLNTPHFEQTIYDILAEWANMAEIFELPIPPNALENLDTLRNALLNIRVHPDQSETAPLLLVDDMASDRALLQRALEPAGYPIIQAGNADEAFTLIYKQSPRIIILDWIMPGISGLELCRKLRREFGPRLYLLILTAHYDQNHAVEALEARANDYLSKPVSRNILLAKLAVAQQMVAFITSLENNCEQLIHQNNSLQSLAMKDALTELANRRGADEFLKNNWQHARRYEITLSCIMLDIDHFKQVNDLYGHDKGDQVLQALGKLLLETSRIGDLTARTGGEEFLVICPQCGLNDALILAERLRESAAHLHGDFPSITISAGVAEIQPDMESAEALLRTTDQALLQAKRQGRNQVVAASRSGHALKK